ncbi:MAG: cysteine hydrolase [Oscillospiraceae bacterium]|nr:cysteine hydrolase [Oscillospiraceae bacterium]
MLTVPLAAQMRDLPVLPFDSLDADDTILVICDMITGFAEHGALASPRVAACIPGIARLLAACKEAKIPAVAFADAHPEQATEFLRYPPHCVIGTDECEVVPQLAAIGGYITIPKNSTNGMLTEAFQAYLQANSNRHTILLCGCCTDICVMQFALTLKAYGDQHHHPYRILLPVALTDTFDSEGHDAETFRLLGLQFMAQAGIDISKEVSYGA